jgi:hypothetical protein
MNTLKINNPCTEDWNKMTPEDKGKFCSKCAKSVQDFRQSTQAEIARVLTNSSEKTCGRFYKYQLVEVQEQPKWRFFRRFAFALLIAFGATLFTVETAMAQNKINSWKSAFNIEKNGVKEQCDYVVEGTTLDGYTQKPIGFVKVKYSKKDGSLIEIMSNANGEFKMELQEKDIITLAQVTLWADGADWSFGRSKPMDLTQPFPDNITILMYHDEEMGDIDVGY